MPLGESSRQQLKQRSRVMVSEPTDIAPGRRTDHGLAGAPRGALSSGVLHEICEGLGVVRMPAREGWPVLDDVARRPQNASLVERARHLIVRAQDVEVPLTEPLHHERN